MALGLLVDGLECLDGFRGVLDVADAFVQALVQVFHLFGEMFIKLADLVLERLIILEDRVDFLDVAEQDADGGIGGLEAALRILGDLPHRRGRPRWRRSGRAG